MTAVTLARPAADLPLLGPLFRLLSSDGTAAIYAALLAVVALLGLAVKTWGLVALGLTGLALVPVMFVVLLAITVG